MRTVSLCLGRGISLGSTYNSPCCYRRFPAATRGSLGKVKYADPDVAMGRMFRGRGARFTTFSELRTEAMCYFMCFQFSPLSLSPFFLTPFLLLLCLLVISYLLSVSIPSCFSFLCHSSYFLLPPLSLSLLLLFLLLFIPS